MGRGIIPDSVNCRQDLEALVSEVGDEAGLASNRICSLQIGQLPSDACGGGTSACKNVLWTARKCKVTLCLDCIQKLSSPWQDAEAALEWLRDAGCDFTASTRNEGELPTFVAARRGNTRLLQVLEDAGCDMGWRNRSGDSAIVAAARAGQVGAAR